MIKVIVAEDQGIVIDGIIAMLKDEKDIEVVGAVQNGEEVLPLLKNQKIDIAILDIQMPGMDGVQLCQFIKKYHPDVKVLILSMYKTKEFVAEIFKIGADGYILKNKGKENLVKAIRAISGGRSFVGDEVQEVLLESMRDQNRVKEKDVVKFTKREKDVLLLIVEGLTSIKIGQKLFIAPATVDTHRRNLIEKTGVANSKELISYAFKNKLVQP